MGDDYVVEGGVALAEAGEPDLDDHCWIERSMGVSMSRSAGEMGRADLLGAGRGEANQPC